MREIIQDVLRALIKANQGACTLKIHAIATFLVVQEKISQSFGRNLNSTNLRGYFRFRYLNVLLILRARTLAPD